MKKFTLLSGIAALATVGAVFAAWQFNENTPSINDGSVGITVMEGVETSARGTFAVSTTGDLAIYISQSTNHKSSVVNVADGSEDSKVTVTYTHTDIVNSEYNYTVTWKISIPTELEPYFTSDEGSATITNVGSQNSFEITIEQIKNSIHPVDNSITTAEAAQDFIDLFGNEKISSLNLDLSVA